MASTITVRIIGDASGFNRAVGEVEGKLKGFAGGVGKIAAGVGAAFAGVGAATFLKDSVGAASDLAESMSKLQAVFGPATAEVEKFAKGADQIGLSDRSAADALGTFGNLFSQLGIGAGDVAKMSTGMVGLAADFASFHNADIADVVAAQTAAFRGEFDAVQRFVPTINAAAVEQEALRLGLADANGEISEQAKAMAVNSLLTKGAGKAAGDFARTSDGLANRQRILAARFDDLKTNLGQKLLPIALKVAEFFDRNLEPTMQAIGTVFRKVADFVGPLVDKFRGGSAEGQKFGERVASGFDKVKKALQPVIDLFDDLVDTIKSQLAAVRAIFDAWVKVASEVWDRFGDNVINAVTDAFKTVAEVARGALQILSGIFDLIKAVLTGKWGDAWNALKKIVDGIWDTIFGVIRGARAGLANAIGFALEGLKGAWDAAWRALSGVVSTVFDGIKRVVVAGINFVLAAIEKLINAPGSGVNALIGVINKIPGIGLPTLPTVDLPRVDLPAGPADIGTARSRGFESVGSTNYYINGYDVDSALRAVDERERIRNIPAA